LFPFFCFLCYTKFSMEGLDKKERSKLILNDLVDDELLSLDEAAKLLKVSESYLLSLVRRGKIKAFKFDEYWFIKLDWIKQFRQQIQDHISEIITAENFDNNYRWIKPIKKKENINNSFFIFSFRLLSFSFLFAIMVLASAWMMPFANNLAISDTYFLSAVLTVSNIYTKPVNSLSKLIITQSKINDEVLTLWVRSILINNQDNIGQVAGTSEGFNE